MAFESKQATTGGTVIKTTVVSGEHIQNITLVDQTGNPLPILGVEPYSGNFYSASLVVVPTTLTTGLNYFIIRNPDATKKIKIKRIVADAIFTGTAAASRSTYAMKKLTGVTATTGTAVPIAKRDTNGANSIAEVKGLATGLTATDGIDANNISHIAHANQLTANMNKDWQFDNPIVLNQNEAIVLQSEGVLVTGSTIVFTIQFYEI